MKKLLTLILVASGGGTDANAIMEAFSRGHFKDLVSRVVLISTKEGAGCLTKALSWNIDQRTVDVKEQTVFEQEIKNLLKELSADVVFLVGCIRRMPVISGLPMYNIHPAETSQFGGNGMYGLTVHKRVLLAIKDRIARGMASPEDGFFTYPTVHEAVQGYDQGREILRASVQIPSDIIRDLVAGIIPLSDLAERLQKHVLPREWLMLPAAVAIAVKNILDTKPEA